LVWSGRRSPIGTIPSYSGGETFEFVDVQAGVPCILNRSDRARGELSGTVCGTLPREKVNRWPISAICLKFLGLIGCFVTVEFAVLFVGVSGVWMRMQVPAPQLR
jgi:hypothetical protein